MTDESTESASTTVANHRSITIFFFVTLIGVSLYLCWPLVVGGHQLTWRDSAYLYYPLFEYIEEQKDEGHQLFWNPFCGVGQPLLADGSSCIYYPLRVVFGFDFLSFTSQFGVYIWLHLLICGSGAFACARSFGLTSLASSCTGLVFVLSAPVLSQTNNIIYLHGVCWLPWSVMFIWLVHQSAPKLKFVYGLLLGMTWACTILGGDPQMVYHGCLACMFLLLLRGLNWLRRFRVPNNELPDFGQPVIHYFALAAMVAAALSAIQWIPSYHANQQSVRKTFEHPRNVYEISEYLKRDNSEGWSGVRHGLISDPWAAPQNRWDMISHHSDRYQFSLPPGNLTEVLLPGAGGRQYPVDDRWFDYSTRLPEFNRQSWYASHYVGAISIFLFIAGCFGRHKSHIGFQWIFWLSLLFCLGSFGVFGPLSFFSPEKDEGFLGRQVGGVFWLMTILLPEYVSFRYPAKLFLFASFGLVLFAGRGLDWVVFHGTRVKVLICQGAGLLIGIAFAFYLLFSVSASSVPNVEKAVSQIVLVAIVHFLIAYCVLGGLIGLVRHGQRQLKPGKFLTLSLLIPLLLVVDLMIANSWILDHGETPDLQQSRITAWRARGMRLYGPRSTEGLLTEQQVLSMTAGQRNQFEQDMLFAKFHLRRPYRRLDSFSSIERMDWTLLQNELVFHSDLRDSLFRQTERAPLNKQSEIAFLPLLESNATSAIYFRTATVVELMNQGKAVVEKEVSDIQTLVQGEITMESGEPGRIKFRTILDQGGWFIFNQQIDEGWICKYTVQDRAEFKTRTAPIYRTNRIMMGAKIPQEAIYVEFSYEPPGHRLGAMITRGSLVAVAFLLVGWPMVLRQKRLSAQSDNFADLAHFRQRPGRMEIMITPRT